MLSRPVLLEPLDVLDEPPRLVHLGLGHHHLLGDELDGLLPVVGRGGRSGNGACIG